MCIYLFNGRNVTVKNHKAFLFVLLWRDRDFINISSLVPMVIAFLRSFPYKAVR